MNTFLCTPASNVGNQRDSRVSISKNMQSWVLIKSSNCLTSSSTFFRIESPTKWPGIAIDITIPAESLRLKYYLKR